MQAGTLPCWKNTHQRPDVQQIATVMTEASHDNDDNDSGINEYRTSIVKCWYSDQMPVLCRESIWQHSKVFLLQRLSLLQRCIPWTFLVPLMWTRFYQWIKYHSTTVHSEQLCLAWQDASVRSSAGISSYNANQACGEKIIHMTVNCAIWGAEWWISWLNTSSSTAVPLSSMHVCAWSATVLPSSSS